jgi:hypothetical protein
MEALEASLLKIFSNFCKIKEDFLREGDLDHAGTNSSNHLNNRFSNDAPSPLSK